MLPAAAPTPAVPRYTTALPHAPEDPMQLRRLIAFVFAAAAALAPTVAQAQIVHADFDTPIFDTGSSMGGPNLLLGIMTQIPAAAVATRLEVWTGEGTGTNTIALWSHDPVNNRPLAPLGSGSWQMGRVNGWQGAPLATPIALTTGEPVWVVWGCVNGSQSSLQATSGPGAQPYRGSFDGGNTWNGPFQDIQWKFRIWSGPAGHYEAYGSGCVGSNRGTPQLGWYGMPMAGGSFQVQLDRAVPGNFAMLSFGDSNTISGTTPLPFALAPLGAPGCAVQGSLLVTVLYGTDPVTGQAVVTVTLPNDPNLGGFHFYNQWFCLDAAANALGLTVSNAGDATIGF